MKTGKEVHLRDFKPSGNYIVLVAEFGHYGPGGTNMYVGSGKETITLIRKVFDLMDKEYDDLKTMLKEADDYNGDGWDYVQLFKI